MKVNFLTLFLLLSFTLSFAYGGVTYEQDQSQTAEQSLSTQQDSAREQAGERGSKQEPAGAIVWRPPLSDTAPQGQGSWIKRVGSGEMLTLIDGLRHDPRALVSLLAAFIALLAYLFNRSTAYRTATIEAQKMGVEINKQYISDPKLLRIEGNYDPSKITAEELAKLKAMAYLKLSVFEIIFAMLPWGQARKSWKAYFEVSLDNCPLLGEELEKNRIIYQRGLIRQYNKWKAKKATSPISAPQQPPEAKSIQVEETATH